MQRRFVLQGKGVGSPRRRPWCPLRPTDARVSTTKTVGAAGSGALRFPRLKKSGQACPALCCGRSTTTACTGEIRNCKAALEYRVPVSTARPAGGRSTTEESKPGYFLAMNQHHFTEHRFGPDPQGAFRNIGGWIQWLIHHERFKGFAVQCPADDFVLFAFVVQVDARLDHDAK